MYHLSFDEGEGIQPDLAWSVDILEDDIKDSSSKLSMLHRKNIIKGELDKYFEKLKILSPKSILQAIFHENIRNKNRRARISGAYQKNDFFRNLGRDWRCEDYTNKKNIKAKTKNHN